jgi:hypothetical protein
MPDALMAQGMAHEVRVQEGVVLSGIEIEGRLGSGGLGTVYLGRQVSLDREVAVKVLAAEVANDPLFLERLGREASWMAKLRHPNVVMVHDFQALEEGGAAIVMELVKGGTLREVIAQHPEGLAVEAAVRLVKEMAAGLAAAHELGVIHRDLKPENVLMDESGCARLTDFGLALPVDESTGRLTLTGTQVGTLGYMAPEQLKGGVLDARLDVYALGVVAYELLTGQVPRGHFDAPRKVRGAVPRGVSEAVMRALRARPEERFESVGAFVRALDGGGERVRLRRGLMMGGGAVVTGMMVLGWGWIREGGGGTAVEGTMVQAARKEVLPEFGPWLDAAAGTRIYEDVILGDWTNENGVLTTDETIGIVEVEETLPKAYDVRVRFTRLTGRDAVAVFFRTEQGTGYASLDSWREGLAGVQEIDGETLQAGYGFRFPLENGRSYELLLEVREDEVRMSVDGVFQKAFEIKGKRLSVSKVWEWDVATRPLGLGVGSYKSRTRFEKIEWRRVFRRRPVEGGGG